MTTLVLKEQAPQTPPNRKRHRWARWAAMAGAGAAMLAVVGISPASANPIHHAGSCSASGDFADCSFDHGDVYRPGTFHLAVTASPNQAVDVFWGITCDKNGYASFGSRTGSFVATAPLNRVLPHPLTRPTHCDAFVDVSLDSGPGSVHGALTYTRWDGR